MEALQGTSHTGGASNSVLCLVMVLMSEIKVLRWILRGWLWLCGTFLQWQGRMFKVSVGIAGLVLEPNLIPVIQQRFSAEDAVSAGLCLWQGKLPVFRQFSSCK